MAIRLSIGPDNRIWADIPYAGGSGPRRAKRVAGVRPKYEKSKRASVKDKFVAWTYPLDMTTCRALRQEFGKALRIDEELAEWARDAIKREEAMIELAASDGTDLDLGAAFRGPAEKLAAAMDNRPYQKVGTQFVVNGQNVLLADQPGLGKTLMTLGGLVASGKKRILVFAPRTAMETVWARESRRWVGAKAFVAVGAPREREAIIRAADIAANSGEMSVLICNPEMVRTKKEVSCVVCGGVEPEDCPSKNKAVHAVFYDHNYPDLFMENWDAVIVDECHRGLIGKNVMSKNISQTRLGMMKLPMAEDAVRIALSGTPYRGKPELLWGVMNWLRPDVFTSFWRWAEQFFEMYEGYAGSKIIGEFREDRKEAYERMLAPFVLRRTKEEVATDLPPKAYGGSPLDVDDPESPIAVWLEMEPAQAKTYERMRTQSSAKLDSGTVHSIGVLSELTRLQQFAICSWDFDGYGVMGPKPLPSNKYNWMFEKIQELLEDGRKVVVASQFTKVINAFARQLHDAGIENYTLTGETKQRYRADMVADFQENPDSPSVFFINTYAGGVAITLDAADDIIFLDETYIPDDQEQVEDRLHRVSRMHNVTAWKLKSLGTVEEAKARISYEREAITKGLLDGPRGIEFAKLLLEAE
jgi:SNF2 family DNA or RNA helicase